jgi:uncharacterized membrane protein
MDDGGSSDRLDRWVDAGLIGREQAEAIRRFEAGGSPTPRGLSNLTELLAYLGGVLVLAGAIAASASAWDDLGSWARVGVLAVATVLALAGGFALRGSSDPAVVRLSAALWFLATLSTAATVGVAIAEYADMDEDVAFLIVGAATTAVALPLWRLAPRGPLHLAAFGAVVTLVLSVVAVSFGDEPYVEMGVALVALGVAWALLARAGRLLPAEMGVVLGAGAAAVGPAFLLDVGSDAIPIVAGLVVSGLVLVVGVAWSRPGATAIGVLALFSYLSWGIAEVGGGAGLPAAVAVGGIGLIVAALVSARAVRRKASG